MLGEDDFANNVSAVNQQGSLGGLKFNKHNPWKKFWFNSILLFHFLSYSLDLVHLFVPV